jgi:hypothetical protein
VDQLGECFIDVDGADGVRGGKKEGDEVPAGRLSVEKCGMETIVVDICYNTGREKVQL